MNYCGTYRSGSYDELYHYGVKGMRWGVRRATKKLSRATNQKDYDSAVSSLNKHRVKASSKLQKLQKQRPKLDDTLRKSTAKDVAKASKLESKASKLDMKIAKNQKKASGFFTSQSNAEKLLAKNTVMKNKSDMLHAKANKMKANYEKAKAKVEANESMRRAFQQGINDIDMALLDAGRKYIKG